MFEPGTQIEKYAVEAELGRGGMAVVYRVRHTTLQSIHALKMLSITGPDVADRLLQEGRLQASLSHPNIVSVTDVVVVDGVPGLVIEFLPDGDLDDALKRGLDDPMGIFTDILRGMAHAHDLGMVHRDLKPANILVQRLEGRWVPKIADFGLAKFFGTQDGPSRTRSGVTLGTPSYMAPEQARDARSVGPKADVWALGCILFELTTGTRLFDGPDALSVLQQVVQGPDPAHLSRLVPPYDSIVRAALQLDPASRPDVSALLEQISGEPKPIGPSVGETLDWDAPVSLPQAAHTFPPESPANTNQVAPETLAPSKPTVVPSATPSIVTTPTRRPSRFRWLSILVPMAFAYTSACDALEHVALTPLLAVTYGTVPSNDVVVVGLDETGSAKHLRAENAALLDRLVSHGATTVVFDATFEPSANDHEPDNVALVESIRRAEQAGVPVVVARRLFEDRFDPILPGLEKNAGTPDLQPDQLFGHIRRAVIHRHTPDLADLWGLSVRAAAAHSGHSDIVRTPSNLETGTYENPIVDGAILLPPVAKPPMIRPDGDLREVQKKAVFVGGYAGRADLKRVPWGEWYGVSIHAAAAQALIRQKALTRLTPESDVLMAGLAGFGTLAFGLVLPSNRRWMGFVVAVASLCFGVLLVASGTLVSLTPILLAGLLAVWSIQGRP